MGRFDEAAAHYERALALNPDDVARTAPSLRLCMKQGRPPEARRPLRTCIGDRSKQCGGNVGHGRSARSRTILPTQPRITIGPWPSDPISPSLRFRLCIAQLPILYRDESEIEVRRRRLSQATRATVCRCRTGTNRGRSRRRGRHQLSRFICPIRGSTTAICRATTALSSAGSSLTNTPPRRCRRRRRRTRKCGSESSAASSATTRSGS